jgi:hypothetical protein
MHSNDSNESNESKKTVDFLSYEESIGSSYSISSSKKYPNNYDHDYDYYRDNNDDGLNARLLLEDKQKSIDKTNKYIFYLICLIISAFISSIILFSIYYFTAGHKGLYYYACISFFVTLFLTCGLCSCMKYKCELEKIKGPFISS